ncbi:MAG: M23 family metallopeptidase [Geobacter sp.]|nr:M23 family metallopeptidase [Geobacter sp.]
MKKFIVKNKHPMWLLLLSACLVSGCASLPEKDKPVWPWEYGNGQGEPNTGEYLAIRAGVAKFGKPPETVKAVKPVSAELPPTGVAPDSNKTGKILAAGDKAIKTEPSAANQLRPNMANRNKKNGYDFIVSEKSTAAANLMLDADSPIYDIAASNFGNAPVSVAINIENGSAQNVSADKTLPLLAIVPANSDRTLVRITARTKGLQFALKYNSVWSMGDYTAVHNCPEHYQFPFGEKVRAFASIANSEDNTPYARNALIFSMPKGTPVLAARKGVVIRISSDEKIDILHEDATIGTYYHLEKIDQYVVVGKAVTTKDVIGVAGTAGSNKEAYMQLTVWSPEPTTTGQLLVSSQRIGFEAVSFPLAFISADSNKGKVLTKNQLVSRGKLLVADKQTRRK